MLHNTGPYGPNETPMTGSPPVNMSQMSGPVNMAHNLQNIGVIGQQSPRTASAHYSLPNYPSYNTESLDMRSHFNVFSGNHQKSNPLEYMPQIGDTTHDTRWQNGISPLNLNAHSNFVPTVANIPPNYSKNALNSTYIPNHTKEQCLPENVSSNKISQMESLQRMQSYFYNTNQDRFSHYNQYFDQNTSPKPIIDETKRKSLENTVKLIENILVNQPTESQNVEKATEEESPSKLKVLLENKTNQIHQNSDTEQKESMGKTKSPNEEIITENEKESISQVSENEINNTVENIVQVTIEQVDVKPLPIVDNNKLTCKDTSVNKSSTTIKESILNVTDSNKNKLQFDINIEGVKEEKNTENYLKNRLHFLRDVNGQTKNNVTEGCIIDGENSVNEATVVIKSGSSFQACYECPHCQLIFRHPKRFLIHTKWHSFGLTNEKREEEARIKELLKKQRREARCVDKHNAKVEKAIEEEDETYPCKDCTKIFCSKGSLKNHRTRFHSGRIRECNLCGAVAMGWAGLKAHAATHSPPYRCPICQKQFLHKHSLIRHTESHMEEDEKNLRCSTCGKRFAIRSRLREHERVHERAERGASFRCSYCAKAFLQAYSLTIHERTHRNEKPYTCDICNSSYGTNSSLKRHLKVSHNRSKPFECSQCGRFFMSERGLVAHNNKLHPEETDGETAKKRRRKTGAKKAKNQQKQKKEAKKKKNKKESEPEAEIEEVDD